MRPPICAICGKDFRDSTTKGGLVYFKMTRAEEEFNESFEIKGITGHPKEVDWFCSDHIQLAEKYKNLSLFEALAKIEELLS